MSFPGDREHAADTLTTLLMNRHSCRAYRPQQVPQATIVRALEIAQRTASWCNVQPWNITVTSGDATERFRQALSAHVESHGWPAAYAPDGDFPFPERYEGVYDVRRKETAWIYYEAVGIARNDRAASARQTFENFRLFGAPHFILITTPRKLGVYGAVDCGAWVGNFMLAAESLGVGTIPQAAIAMASGFVRGHFGIGDDQMVVCGISFGFPDREHKYNAFRTTRADLAENVTFLDK
jgi:nitroreductase